MLGAVSTRSSNSSSLFIVVIPLRRRLHYCGTIRIATLPVVRGILGVIPIEDCSHCGPEFLRTPGAAFERGENDALLQSCHTRILLL
jgi:hypothetical protein